KTQTLDPRVVRRVALWCTLELRLHHRQTALVGLCDCPLERGRSSAVVDCCPKPLELIRLGVPHAGAKDETVERELEVVDGRTLADPDGDVLLEGRTGADARVVVRPEETRGPERLEPLGERSRRPQQFAVVTGTVGFEPVPVVVVFEFAQELE